jgi:hypothetical protein
MSCGGTLSPEFFLNSIHLSKIETAHLLALCVASGIILRLYLLTSGEVVIQNLDSATIFDLFAFLRRVSGTISSSYSSSLNTFFFLLGGRPESTEFTGSASDILQSLGFTKSHVLLWFLSSAHVQSIS